MGGKSIAVALALLQTATLAGSCASNPTTEWSNAIERYDGPASTLQQARAGGGSYAFYRSDGTVVFREVGGVEQTLSAEAFEALIQDRLTDRTVMTGDDAHGWQVEYTAPDGRAYLWYPGNSRLPFGRWRVRIFVAASGDSLHRTVQVCYTYADAYNPYTGSGPGQEECELALLQLEGPRLLEWRKGDPFKLATGVIPYERQKDDKPAWP